MPSRRPRNESLEDLDPLEVFRQRYRADHGADPPLELERAFKELLAEVEAAPTPSEASRPDAVPEATSQGAA